jgi:hypothetical protein
MIYKYLIKGSGKEGHITTEYGSAGGKQFKHSKLNLKEPPF